MLDGSGAISCAPSDSGFGAVSREADPLHGPRAVFAGHLPAVQSGPNRRFLEQSPSLLRQPGCANLDFCAANGGGIRCALTFQVSDNRISGRFLLA